MMRPLFIEIVLFFLPFVVYGLFLLANRKGLLDPVSWPLSRVASLAIVALALMIGSFAGFVTFGGPPDDTIYIPAHVDENGNFVPGRTVPRPK